MHSAQALIIHCIDFRIQEAIEKLLQHKGLNEHSDVISIAGGAKEYAHPASAEYQEFLLSQIEMSVKFHGIHTVMLIQHQDCGAYGGSSAFTNFAHEEREYKKDMQALKETILERYPQLMVEMYIALLSGEVIEI